jgi:hypothetical protein
LRPKIAIFRWGERGRARENNGRKWRKKEESGVKWGIEREIHAQTNLGKGVSRCFSELTSHALMKKAASSFLPNFATISQLAS